MTTTTPDRRAPERRMPTSTIRRQTEPPSSATTPEPTKEVVYSNVLVPLDGSDRSLEAMPTAHALAEAFDAELHTIRVNVGPVGAITARANQLESPLLCLSTRARGRIGRAVFGSVAAAVMEHSGPTVAVGPVAERPGWSPASRSWPAPMSSDRVVAYVDGSEASESLVPLAAGWARALDKELTILTVVEDAPAPIRLRNRDRHWWPDASPHAYVERLVTRWCAHVPRLRGVVRGDPIGPASGVRAHLAEEPAALVVVSARVRAGFRSPARTTSAASIVRTSTAPCLVVPALTLSAASSSEE